MSLTKLKEHQIEETLKDFKCLLPRYNEVKYDKVLLKEFCRRNRNPIWDITNVKYFKTGLKSKALIESDEIGTNEHYVQRSICMEILFKKLSKNPNMTPEEFTSLLKRYSSTILLTKKEHQEITKYTKNTDISNYMAYRKVGIKVSGISNILKNIPRVI